METSPTSQPDEFAPPPASPRSKRSFGLSTIAWLLGIAAVTLALLPVILKKPHHEGRPEVINNLKQISLALSEFDSEYGQLPSASTIAAVAANTNRGVILGSDSSNQLFRQLIATGLNSEKVFWASTAATPRKGDDVIGPKALAKGECGFTYISGLSLKDDPGAPIVMAPVIPGTWKFDPKPYKGKAAVLFLDSSAQMLPIDKNGDVILNGMNLFDPRQPYWKGKAPDIKWPE